MNDHMGALNPIAFKLGPFLVHWYGIIIASGAVLGVLLAINETKRQRVSADDIYDLVFWALPIGLIGARIYYVIFEWQYYSQHLNEIIAIWQGGI
ncbi:prolipoprotein diacylglyceryl transferase, partial [Limosilactobacillus mucosae]|nr:prolipoprotein diacylglyceryl transferase [Limosilactobacillus mucosae]